MSKQSLTKDGKPREYKRHPSRDETDTGHAMQTWEATVNRVFIEIHTDASGTGAGGNEIIPSGWYHLAEALKVLETARLTIMQEIINVEWARLGAKDVEHEHARDRYSEQTG